MRHLNSSHSDSHPLVGSIDPRIRLLAGMLLIILAIASGTPAFPTLVAVFCFPLTLYCGMRPGILFLRILHPLFIAIVMLLLKMLNSGGEIIGTLLLPLITFSIYHEGLHEGLLIASRIIGSASVALLISQTMNFTEAMAAFSWLRAPKGLIDVSLFAWRSLFTLYEDAAVVYTAQRNRLGYSSIRLAIRSFGSMAGMLTIRAFDSSHAMTTAMVQRGYDGSLPLLRASRPAVAQVAGLLLFAILAALTWKFQN